jgi:hypothetical protein
MRCLMLCLYFASWRLGKSSLFRWFRIDGTRRTALNLSMMSTIHGLSRLGCLHRGPGCGFLGFFGMHETLQAIQKLTMFRHYDRLWRTCPAAAIVDARCSLVIYNFKGLSNRTRSSFTKLIRIQDMIAKSALLPSSQWGCYGDEHAQAIIGWLKASHRWNRWRDWCIDQSVAL